MFLKTVLVNIYLPATKFSIFDLCLEELYLFIYIHSLQKKYLSMNVLFINKQTNCQLVLENISWQYFHPSLLANKQTTKCTNITGFPANILFSWIKPFIRENMKFQIINGFPWKVIDINHQTSDYLLIISLLYIFGLGCDNLIYQTNKL